MKYLLLFLLLLPTRLYSQLYLHTHNTYYDGVISSAIESFERCYYRYPFDVNELKNYVCNFYLDDEVFEFYANGEFHLQKDSIYCWIDSMTIKTVPGYCFFSFRGGAPTFYLECNRCLLRKDYRELRRIASPAFLDKRNLPIVGDEYEKVHDLFRLSFYRKIDKKVRELHQDSLSFIANYTINPFILHYERDTLWSFCNDCLCTIETELRRAMKDGLREFFDGYPQVQAVNFIVMLPIRKCDED